MLNKAVRLITRVEMCLAMTTLIGFTVIIFLGAAARVFKSPLNWSTDIALFLFAWATFLGGDLAFRDGRLVNVNVILEFLPINARKAAAVAVYAIILVFLYFMIRYGIMLCGTTRHRSFNGVPGFSYMWVTIAIPICCSFMSLTAIGRLVKLLRSQDPAEVAKM